MATKKPSKFDPGIHRKTRGRPLGSKTSSKDALESPEIDSVEEDVVEVEQEVAIVPEPVQEQPAPKKPRYKATQNFSLNMGGRQYTARRGDVIDVDPCDIREFLDRGIIVSF